MTDGSGLVHATSLEHAEQMRVIRNSCRLFMTNDQHEISQAEQERWFARLDPTTFLPFVYRLHQQGQIHVAGYGIVRREFDLWWVSGGLLPQFRGQGIGKLLFGELADYVNAKGESCWLSVLVTNLAAVWTYKSLGFIEQWDGPGLATMKRDPRPRPVSP